MMTAPPLARDRLMGLAHIDRSFVDALGGASDKPGRLPARMSPVDADANLQRICDVVIEMLDRDLFPWLEAGREPTPAEKARATAVIADRLAGTLADPIIRNAQEQRQLAALRAWLLRHGYQELPDGADRRVETMPPGAFAFRMNLQVGGDKGRKVKLPIDCVVRPLHASVADLPVLIEAKSAGDATNTNKRRKEEAQKATQLRAEYRQDVQFVLFLCGYFEPGYLGYEASEGIDWVWEHRIDDLAQVLDAPHAPVVLRDPPVLAGYVADSLETQRLSHQNAIDAARNLSERNRLGQYPTRFDLAGVIVRQALTHVEPGAALSFLEPALATGAFFSALRADVGNDFVMAHADGVEIDPKYVEIAQRLWGGEGLRVHRGDFFDFAAEPLHRGRYNLLCTNPPYVRHHHLPSSYKLALQARVAQELGLRVSGLSGLYLYFVLLADALLADGAVATWLLPAEFMYVNYGQALRDYLTRHVTLLSLHQFDPDEVQFDDALVSSCVVTYRKTPPDAGSTFQLSFGGTLAAPRLSRPVAAKTAAESAKWSVLHSAATGEDRSLLLTVGDLFAIKRGLATGANDFFIVDETTIERHEIPARFLRPVLPPPRLLKETIIHAHADGTPQLGRRLFLLACDESPEWVAAHYPGLWAYLQSGVARSIHKGYLCASKEVWYFQEQRTPAPFLATYMGRGSIHTKPPVRFLLNHSAAIVTNVYLNLYPRPPLAALLKEEPRRAEELLHVLNAIPADEILRSGRTYGGGLHKVEPKELASVVVRAQTPWLARINEKQLTLF
jgi:adenine-specific DNA-methyltransferase